MAHTNSAGDYVTALTLLNHPVPAKGVKPSCFIIKGLERKF